MRPLEELEGFCSLEIRGDMLKSCVWPLHLEGMATSFNGLQDRFLCLAPTVNPVVCLTEPLFWGSGLLVSCTLVSSSKVKGRLSSCEISPGNLFWLHWSVMSSLISDSILQMHNINFSDGTWWSLKNMNYCYHLAVTMVSCSEKNWWLKNSSNVNRSTGMNCHIIKLEPYNKILTQKQSTMTTC